MLMVLEKKPVEWATPEPNISGTWYIVVVEPQQEARVYSWLKGWRFDAYFPQYKKMVRGNYGKSWPKERPMLPGYVFASFDVSQNAWKNIPTFPGVRRIIMVDERPVPVPESALYHIRKAEDRAKTDFGKRKRPKIECRVGDQVWIMDHFSFTGLQGEVVEILDAKGKIILHIDLLGQKTRTVVGAHQVLVV